MQLRPVCSLATEQEKFTFNANRYADNYIEEYKQEYKE